MDSLPLEQFRRRLSDAVGRAEHAGAATAVTRHGRPAAVLVSPTDFAELQRLREQEDERAVRERRAAAQSEPDRMVRYESADDLAARLGLGR
ncbi:prevent-host-death family protein [Murinocardiopsis flavida]|uniref:Antitoxin n=1 Tax=Murinocardiopsis flavida TaxID=645275 RepID=A0A2P8DNY6_9ACTN|nr:type II toxin-antitoxin system Phd/YefM family antitoxin [Murinocardiopsis flavida]PSK98932.1 prevent-host-death family protein [Murinocardiopsis flavida]